MCVSAALVIQHAKRMRLIGLSSVANPAVQNFDTLLHKQRDFREEMLLDVKCVVLILFTTLLRNISTAIYTTGRV
jgi:hypothetical protein